MAAKTTTRVPGEESARSAELEDGANERVREGVTALNNTTGRTANDVGLDREAVVRAQAVADAARRGQTADLAPAADIGKPAAPTSAKRKVMMNGQEVEVEVPLVRRNSAVEQFGPESKLPVGTAVNKDGTAFEGAGEPYGVIGNINTPQGKLVNRIIPLDAVKSAT